MKGQEPWEIHCDGIHCNLAIEQLAPAVVVLRISGTDIGEFGDAPMLALTNRLEQGDIIHLFVDARDVRGASIEVSGEWARWLCAHKARLHGVRMLTGSRFVQVTAEFVRRFAELEGIMRIDTEPVAFDAALAESIQGA